jgi:hypothetical protein
VNRYSILEEPTGDSYRGLLKSASATCHMFSLVSRDSRTLDERIPPLIVEELSVSEWPGTKLEGHRARLLRGRLTSGAVEILTEMTRGLYGWIQPDLPEDLCLYRHNGAPWMVSIAHERDAYLELSTAEAPEILEACARIQLRLNRDP